MPRIKRPLVLALTLGLTAFTGCDRGEIHDEVEEMKDAKDKVKEELKEQLAHAKDEALALKDKLPPKEKVKAGLREAGAEVKEVMLKVGERMKRQAGDLKDALREKMADAD